MSAPPQALHLYIYIGGFPKIFWGGAFLMLGKLIQFMSDILQMSF